MFHEGSVSVDVPATSANLGPGFDCLGLALGLFDTLSAQLAEVTSVSIEGEGEGSLPTDERHLVIRSMHAAWRSIGLDPVPVALSCINRIPQSRGMGSSSAAIVGGLALARALLADGAELLPNNTLLRLANEIEGHPDNVAPAIYGGFVVCGQDGDEVWATHVGLHPDVSGVLFIPPTPLSTELARGLLPDSIPHRDAAANSGRAALLVAALSEHPDMLLRATEDFLHQSYRAGAMPESAQLISRLRALGAPAFVSGAGPSVLCFTAPELPSADGLLALCPEKWQACEISVGVLGVHRA